MRMIGAVLLLSAFPAAQAASVPFVGCKADGQEGPLDVPKGEAKIVEFTPNVAANWLGMRALVSQECSGRGDGIAFQSMDRRQVL